MLSMLVALCMLGSPSEPPRTLTHPTVFVTLDEPAAVTAWRRALDGGATADDAVATAVAQLRANHAEQDRFRRALAGSGLDAPEAFSMQRLANGVAVVVAAADIAALGRLPGVRATHPVSLARKANRFSVGYLGAIDAWGAVAPLTGAGMRVGIIDTGLDYLHADFGGPGAAADYDADDPEVLEEGTFPNDKVVGGWDFAGTEYGYSQEAGVPDSLVPVPDPDPMDLDGHGSHVAGSVAGYGVDGDGTTWPGPWDLSLDLEGFRIGPGMAPEADLYALKVFGDTKAATASALTTAALEWAVDPDGDGDFGDHLDVVNISLGADYGISGGYEIDVYRNAIDAGLVVVAAAGNAWNIQFVTSDPCAAEGVICVANCNHDGLPFEALHVDAPEGLQGNYLARRSNFGPDLTEEALTGDLVLADPPLGCGALVNAEAVAGHIAVMDRGECKYWEKVTAAQEAGAIAAIVVNHEAGIPPKMNWDGDTVTIPSVIVRKVDGDLLKAALAEETTVSVTLKKWFTAFVDEKTGWISGSSSRGPTRQGGQLRLKPDLTAPGSDITSVAARTGDGGTRKSGTSMASPTAAGIMTLLRQARPLWSPAELKAWAMGTAAPDVIRSPNQPPLSPTRQGAGRIDAARALDTEVLAYDRDHPLRVSLTFDALDVTAPVEEVRTVRVDNRGELARTFSVTYEAAVDIPGADIIVAGDDLTVPAGEAVDLTVTLVADPAALRHVRAPNLGATSGGAKIHRTCFAEEAGHLVFREGEAVTLRLPILAGPRPASDMHATLTEASLRGMTGRGRIALAGAGMTREGPGPWAVRSLVTPFELKLESPDEDIGNATYAAGTFTADEVQATINVADLRAVGLTSDYGARIRAGQGIEETTLFLALAVWAPWGSPVETFFVVEYDRDGDGGSDGYFVTSHDADAFFVEHVPYGAESSRLGLINHVDPFRETIPLHMSDVMVLPLPAAALGMTAQDAAVAFKISAYHVHHHEAWSLVDATPWFHHDPTRQVFDFQQAAPGMPLFPDVDGAEIPYAWDADGVHSPGLMLVHHHNPAGSRVDVVQIDGPGCWRPDDCQDGTVCVPVIGRCVACEASEQCGPGQHCEDYACVDDCADETANPCPAGTSCDMLSGRCGECVYNDQCPAGTWCDPGSLRCVVCTQAWDCGPGEYCAPRHGTCEGDCRLPISNACPAGQWCNQASGRCVDCLFDAHCHGGTICDEWGTWTCVEGPWQPGPDTVEAEPEILGAPDAWEPGPAGSASGGCAAGSATAGLTPLLLLLLLLFARCALRRQPVQPE
jgi:subtilisin family serine protease